MKYKIKANRKMPPVSPENKQHIYFSVCLDGLKIEVNKLNLFSLNFPLLTTDAANIKSVRVWS